MAKLRSCVIMLDSNCDDIVLHMFHHFLNAISKDHFTTIQDHMEAIMISIINDSDEISQSIVSLLLVFLEQQHVISTSAYSLVCSVAKQCKGKLKLHLFVKELVEEQENVEDFCVDAHFMSYTDAITWEHDSSIMGWSTTSKGLSSASHQEHT